MTQCYYRSSRKKVRSAPSIFDPPVTLATRSHAETYIRAVSLAIRHCPRLCRHGSSVYGEGRLHQGRRGFGQRSPGRCPAPSATDLSSPAHQIPLTMTSSGDTVPLLIVSCNRCERAQSWIDARTSMQNGANHASRLSCRQPVR
jgi:hypothetical protein